jgi:hypothetical protein
LSLASYESFLSRIFLFVFIIFSCICDSFHLFVLIVNHYAFALFFYVFSLVTLFFSYFNNQIFFVLVWLFSSFLQTWPMGQKCILFLTSFFAHKSLSFVIILYPLSQMKATSLNGYAILNLAYKIRVGGEATHSTYIM